MVLLPDPKSVTPKEHRENVLVFVKQVRDTCPPNAQATVFPLLDKIIIKEAALGKTQQELLGNKLLDSKNMEEILGKIDQNETLYDQHRRLVDELNQLFQDVLTAVEQNP